MSTASGLPPVFIAADLSAAVPGGAVTIHGDEARHAVVVRRMTPGEAVHLVDGRGRRVAGTVGADPRGTSSAGTSGLVVHVDAVTDEPEPQPRIVIVQAIPKSDRGESAVALATEVGADAIVPWAASRCVAVWRGDRAAKGRQRWAEAARESAKQARRARIPEVAPAATLSEVEVLVRSAAVAVVLHETATRPLASLAVPPTGDIVIVVGPEGGLSPQELERLAAAGGVPARLGPSVLRTSSAAGVAAGILLSRTARWGDVGGSVT